jgi:hypothetical protein
MTLSTTPHDRPERQRCRGLMLDCPKFHHRSAMVTQWCRAMRRSGRIICMIAALK